MTTAAREKIHEIYLVEKVRNVVVPYLHENNRRKMFTVSVVHRGRVWSSQCTLHVKGALRKTRDTVRDETHDSTRGAEAPGDK